MKTKTLRKKLKEIASESNDSIRKEVATEAIYYTSGDCVPFFQDLLTYGCINGTVGSLIYYHDTHVFFIKYYDEIEMLRLRYEQDYGESPTIQGDLMNFYAWFSFELTARELVKELGITNLL